jgi:hypothetical protein
MLKSSVEKLQDVLADSSDSDAVPVSRDQEVTLNVRPMRADALGGHRERLGKAVKITLTRKDDIHEKLLPAVLCYVNLENFPKDQCVIEDSLTNAEISAGENADDAGIDNHTYLCVILNGAREKERE